MLVHWMLPKHLIKSILRNISIYFLIATYLTALFDKLHKIMSTSICMYHSITNLMVFLFSSNGVKQDVKQYINIMYNIMSLFILCYTGRFYLMIVLHLHVKILYMLWLGLSQ